MYVPFAEFFTAWSAQTRSAFLRAVTTPHLLVPRLGAITPEGAEQPTDKVDATRAVAHWDMHALLAVCRRDGRRGRITLGRGPVNDLIVPDPRISKIQLWLERRATDDTWLLGDGGSTNGTRVDGVAVPPTRGATLRSGSRIRLAEALDVVFVEPVGLYGIIDRLRRAIQGARPSTPAPSPRSRKRR